MRAQSCSEGWKSASGSIKIIGSFAAALPVPEKYVTLMSEKTHERYNEDLALLEAKPKLKRPPLYKVILLNDDYTPMEFVVHILEIFFCLDRETATRIMLEVHTRGMGVCGVFTHDIAQTKVVQVNHYSREHEHPLKCTMEKTD